MLPFGTDFFEEVTFDNGWTLRVSEVNGAITVRGVREISLTYHFSPHEKEKAIDYINGIAALSPRKVVE